MKNDGLIDETGDLKSGTENSVLAPISMGVQIN